MKFKASDSLRPWSILRSNNYLVVLKNVLLWWDLIKPHYEASESGSNES